MTRPAPLHDLVRAGLLDAELGALLWLLVEARVPVVVVGRPAARGDGVVDALRACLPAGAAPIDVAPDDEFEWLPEAASLGWRAAGSAAAAPAAVAPSETPAGAPGLPVSASSGVLVVRGLAAPEGVAADRARLVVRSLALGYGLLATMAGSGLEDALEALHAPAVGTAPDERSSLGIVLAVSEAGGADRVTAAHYVRPVALDTHGHVQRQPPAVLAAWNPATGGWDHFEWGVLPDLAGRLGVRPAELDRELARRAARLLVTEPR